MTGLPRLIGMVHLGPLPGSPRYGSLDGVIRDAVDDARILEDSGFPAAILENFGDDPFFPDRVPAVTVAAMTRVMAAVADATDLVLGVNVLRNDALSALSIASVTPTAMIRTNVLTGTMYTDQGPIVGRAAEVARLRRSLAPEVQILADVFVKHATPPPGLAIEQAAVDTWERGGADALIVSGSGTGEPADAEDARRIRKAVPGAPLLVGSGVTPDSLSGVAGVTSGVIVGSWVKVDGRASNRVDRARAEQMVEAARSAGLA